MRRYFNLSLHKVYSCIIVIRVDICLTRCKAANDSLICLCKLQNLTQLSIVFLRLPSLSRPDEVISFLQKCKFLSVKLSTCCAMEKIKTQDNWKSINGLRMTFHIVQFLFFSYLLISRNMVTIIKKITLDTNSLKSGLNFFLPELKIGVKYFARQSSNYYNCMVKQVIQTSISNNTISAQAALWWQEEVAML